MNHNLGNVEEILSRHISGFHQYILQAPIRLAYVSQNFCDMTGYTPQEMLSEDADLYASIVHPGDKALYFAFIQKLASGEQTASAQYRILCKDGAVLYVNDTVTAKQTEDGVLVGNSVLTDITHVKTENDNLRFLNETIPCGFLKYTCEKNPKITYINEQMLQMLHLPETREGEMDYLELFRENIYLMVPLEERRKFSVFLEQVRSKGTPITGELTLLRFDGTKARFYGWVTKCVNAQGQEEFQSVCMDITERYQMKRANQTARYLKAIMEVYDKIFECDSLNKTMKFLHGQESDIFSHIRNIPMQFQEASGQWVQNTVMEEDRAAVQKFLDSFFARTLPNREGKPPQIQFHALGENGAVNLYSGLFLKIDSDVSLFCCRSIAQQQEADFLRNENISLRNMNENMQELVMRFTDGIVAFEVEDNNYVKPLYASENVSHFFGYTREEWMPLTQKRHSLKKFVSKSSVAYEDFKKLLKDGEAEFVYTDLKTNQPQRIKAICSQRGNGGSAPRYVMLYKLNEEKPKAAEAEQPQIYIRTFGYFDVFIDEKPIAFRNKKSKELFALLVDRRGGFISSEEAISFLWEDEEANAVTLSRYRKVALRLKNILEEYGIADVMESVDGKRRIVTDKVRCDLYDYLSQKEEYAQLFKGSYLSNYSWGETTLGELLHE